MADTFGVRTWFILGGIVTGLMGIIGFFIPAVIHIEDDRQEDAIRDSGKPVGAVSAVEVD